MTLFDRVGVDSTGAMETAMAACPFFGPLPLCYVTSSVRDIPNPYHGTYNAIDLGNNADQTLGSPQMDGVARWLAANYGPVSLELIHVYQDGTTEEWKFGVKQPTGWYGWPTLLQHRGHVHWAATLDGVAAVTITPPPAPDWLDTVDEQTLRAIIADEVTKVLNTGTAHGQPSWAHTVQATLAQEQANYNAIKQVAGGVVAVNSLIKKG
jgi:hypothetical protein